MEWRFVGIGLGRGHILSAWYRISVAEHPGLVVLARCQSFMGPASRNSQARGSKDYIFCGIRYRRTSFAALFLRALAGGHCMPGGSHRRTKLLSSMAGTLANFPVSGDLRHSSYQVLPGMVRDVRASLRTSEVCCVGRDAATAKAARPSRLRLRRACPPFALLFAARRMNTGHRPDTASRSWTSCGDCRMWNSWASAPGQGANRYCRRGHTALDF